MGQIYDQYLAEETAKLQEQAHANAAARIQADLQSARDRRANLDSQVADLEAEVASVAPQPEAAPALEEQPQG